MSKNEMVGKPAVFGANVTKPEVRSRISGASLLPNFAKSGRGAIQHRYKYWVGVTPNCPVESIDCAGINFPKVNELIIPDPMKSGMSRRVPVIGAIVELSEDKIRLLRERLPRIVVRIIGDEGEKDEPGTGQNIGDAHRRPRRGQLISIPTDEDIEFRRNNGKPTRAYVRHPNDVPAVHFMFIQLCADQQKGNRGEVYPETLETTGIEWPEELEDADPVESTKTASAIQDPVGMDSEVPPISSKKRGRPKKAVADALLTEDLNTLS